MLNASGVPRVGNVRENFGGLAILAVRRVGASILGLLESIVIGIYHSSLLPFSKYFRFPDTTENPNTPFRRCTHAHFPPKVSRTLPNAQNS